MVRRRRLHGRDFCRRAVDGFKTLRVLEGDGMNAKLFEIRDEGMLIPVMAVRVAAEGEAERWLLSWSGYGQEVAQQAQFVLVAQINAGYGTITSDNFKWGDRRTMLYAHKYIKAHFDELESGAVIDVEFILGESEKPKEPQRLTAGVG